MLSASSLDCKQFEYEVPLFCVPPKTEFFYNTWYTVGVQ